MSRGKFIVSHRQEVMNYTYQENIHLGRAIVPQTKLVEWIEDQLRQRDWRPADLARAAGVRDSTISRVLNGNAKAGPELCNAISEALGVSPVEVFRIAELLPPSAGNINELSQDESEWLEVYRSLSPDQRQTIFGVVLGWRDRLRGRG